MVAAVVRVPSLSEALTPAESVDDPVVQ